MDSKKKWKFVEWKFHKNWQKTFVPEDGNSDWLGDYALIPKKENTTYLTFNEWLPLYNADPSSWFVANYKWSDAKNHICPVCVMEEKLQKKNNSKYIVSEEYQYNPTKKKYQIILFTNRWNYWKWKRFITKKITRQKEAKESIDNLKEYQMLVQYAQKRADERVAESQKQLQAAIDENVRLIGEATEKTLNSSNDNIVIPTVWNF